eukprot:scaffold593_cov382-Prasinococcus_capsulatus_cf.AAC.12
MSAAPDEEREDVLLERFEDCGYGRQPCPTRARACPDSCRLTGPCRPQLRRAGRSKLHPPGHAVSRPCSQHAGRAPPLPSRKACCRCLQPSRTGGGARTRAAVGPRAIERGRVAAGGASPWGAASAADAVSPPAGRGETSRPAGLLFPDPEDTLRTGSHCGVAAVCSCLLGMAPLARCMRWWTSTTGNERLGAGWVS